MWGATLGLAVALMACGTVAGNDDESSASGTTSEPTTGFDPDATSGTASESSASESDTMASSTTTQDDDRTTDGCQQSDCDPYEFCYVPSGSDSGSTTDSGSDTDSSSTTDTGSGTDSGSAPMCPAECGDDPECEQLATGPFDKSICGGGCLFGSCSLTGSSEPAVVGGQCCYTLMASTVQCDTGG